MYTPSNSTLYPEDFASVIESQLHKNGRKNEIYFYDNIYTMSLGKYFINLEDILDEDVISLYDPVVLNQTCYYDDYLIGLPFSIDYTFLYSNEELLNKYNKTIPRTWEELLETGEEIIKKEKELYDNDIIGFLGLFDDTENGLRSIYEYLYSYRDSIDSPMPEIMSQKTIDALK
eukprot:jgi/Orpsp1_1/1174142/evm.model.c7180000049064.1